MVQEGRRHRPATALDGLQAILQKKEQGWQPSSSVSTRKRARRSAPCTKVNAVNNFWKALAGHPADAARNWAGAKQIMAPCAGRVPKEMLDLAGDRA